jgi:hypothetical protein
MALARGNFSLTAECAALIRSLKTADSSWYAMCSAFRDAGLHWSNIKTECREQRISAGTWAAENAPLSKRWLDKYAEFAGRWDEFQTAWDWSQSLTYAPERRPGLWGCFDLMDAKQRFATYSEARKRSYRGDNGLGTVVPIRTSERTLLHGDVSDMMREHLADASIDVAIGDVPYFLRGPEENPSTDCHAQQTGKKPLFNEEWDRFESIEDYETFCTGWIDEAMRCLNDEGSLFVFGTHHNLGLINRICQMKEHVIINEIIWVRRNSRPNIATRRLQASHQNILWIVKDPEKYRFNYRLCKRNQYDDWLSKRNAPARDVWECPDKQLREQGSPSVAETAGSLRETIGRSWETRWFAARSVFRVRYGRGRCLGLGNAVSIDRARRRLRADDPGAGRRRRKARRRIGPVTQGADTRLGRDLFRIFLTRRWKSRPVPSIRSPPVRLEVVRRWAVRRLHIGRDTRWRGPVQAVPQ